MTYEELVDFIENKMSMSHVYQPLLIRSLVDAGGAAEVRQLAQVFPSQDESQRVKLRGNSRADNLSHTHPSDPATKR